MKCRICNALSSSGTMLLFDDMPKASQLLPSKPSDMAAKGECLSIFQCRYCGTVQLANDPVPYWSHPIRSTHISAEMQDLRARQFKLFSAWHALKGKKVIEIGCSNGDYLELLKNADMLPDGMEAITGMFPSPSYSAFFMFNYLEHLTDPEYELRRISDHLEPGAVGLIEVPNFEEAIHIGQFSEFCRDHLIYFTRRTIHNLLERCGFDVIDSRVEFHDYILSVTVQKKKAQSFMVFEVMREKLKRDISKWVDREGGVAIWGAGHQALMICALYNLHASVDYVIDSCKAKQGKITPASGIRIVAPEHLEKEPVGSVLIIAGGYSDEIARLMKEKHPNISLAIIRGISLEIVND
jgi:hypothetical protein